MKINGLYGSNSLITKELSHNPTITEVEMKKNNPLSISESYQDEKTSLPNYLDIDNKTEKSQSQMENKHSDLNDVIQRISTEDIQLLEDNNINIEDSSSEEIEKNLKRIKEERGLRREGVEAEKKSLNEKKENIENTRYQDVPEHIVRLLELSNMEVTQENIDKLQVALQLTSVAENLSQEGMKYFINHNLTLTPSNLYKATYSSQGKAKITKDNTNYESLKHSIAAVVDRTIGMDKEDGMKIGQWLVENQLAVTEETLWSYKDLEDFKNNYKEENIIGKLIAGYENGIRMEDVYLGAAQEHRMDSIISALNHITEDGISYTLSSGKVDNLSILELHQGQIEYSKIPSEESNHNWKERSIEEVKVYRQLEELRLKLTYEAGSKLLKSGIQVETESLSNLVNELKEREDLYYKGLLQDGGSIVSDDNVQLLRNTLNQVSIIRTLPSATLSMVLKNHLPKTMDSILQEGSKLKQEWKDASSSYETMMTEPRKDLGDSIEKAFRNVDDILKDLGLDVNKENQKAVRSLAYNAMELSPENIIQMKAFEKNVSYMMKELHPDTTVQLIRNGINPSNMPIDELNQYIDSINQDIGVTTEEKYSKFLWNLEREQNITSSEKEAYIGLYRLLHNVDKTDGAALGALVKSGKEITLNNLLEAVRTRKLGGIESIVDDSIGLTSELNRKNKSIMEQVEAGFHKDETSYNRHMVKESLDQLSNKATYSMDHDILSGDLSLEELNHRLSLVGSEDTEKDYYLEKQLQMKEIVSNNKLEYGELLKEFELEPTIQNIKNILDYHSRNNTVFHKYKKLQTESKYEVEMEKDNSKNTLVNLGEVSDTLVEAFTDASTIEHAYEQLEDSMNNFLKSNLAEGRIDYSRLSLAREIVSGFRFASSASNGKRYQIPLQVGDSITNIQVTLKQGQDDSGKVDMKIDSEALGKLGIHISVRNGNINGMIQVESRYTEDIINSSMERITDALSSTELKISNLSVVLNPKVTNNIKHLKSNTMSKDIKDIKGKEEVSTNTLYDISKTLLLMVKEIENTIGM